MTTLPQSTIDRMVREANEVERGSANECVQNICCHVKALACEIERLEAQLACHTGTASWLMLEQLTAIREALGMPSATVPEMVERIGELRRDSLGEVLNP